MMLCEVTEAQLRDDPHLRAQYLFQAAIACDLETVETILESGYVRVDAVHSVLGTVLHAAANNRGRPEIMERLLEEDIPLDARTHAGSQYPSSVTALITAVKADNVEATRALLEAGANPNPEYQGRPFVDFCRQLTKSENENFKDQPACEVLYEWLEN